MITLNLDGVLSERFGSSFELYAKSVSEAVSALGCMLDGFSNFIAENNFHVFVDGDDVDEADVGMTYDADISVTLMLAIEGGGGNSGIFAIVAGVALMVVGFWNPAAWGASAKMLAIGFGASLAISGVGTMMMPKASMAHVDEEGNRASYGFGGAVTTVEQGNVMPLGYGELFQGGFVISARIKSEFV